MLLSIFYLLVLAIIVLKVSFIKHLQWCVLIVSTWFHRVLQTVGAKGALDDLVGHNRNLIPVTFTSKVQGPLPKKHHLTSEWKDFLWCPCAFGCLSCTDILPRKCSLSSHNSSQCVTDYKYKYWCLIYLPGFISMYLWVWWYIARWTEWH